MWISTRKSSSLALPFAGGERVNTWIVGKTPDRGEKEKLAELARHYPGHTVI
jgi:hypothetical protein